MKKILLYIINLSLIVLLVGCVSNTKKNEDNNEHKEYKEYTFPVSTGDTIQVKLDVSDKYDLVNEIPFKITNNEETLTLGLFISLDAYQQQIDKIKNDENSKIIKEGNKDGNNFVFWSQDEEKYNYVVMIKDSSTGVMLYNSISEESAKECFEKLDITVIHQDSQN